MWCVRGAVVVAEVRPSNAASNSIRAQHKGPEARNVGGRAAADAARAPDSALPSHQARGWSWTYSSPRMKRNEGVTGAASLTEAAISTPMSIKTKPIVFVQRRTLPVPCRLSRAAAGTAYA